MSGVTVRLSLQLGDEGSSAVEDARFVARTVKMSFQHNVSQRFDAIVDPFGCSKNGRRPPSINIVEELQRHVPRRDSVSA
jgi:hypothetical protein